MRHVTGSSTPPGFSCTYDSLLLRCCTYLVRSRPAAAMRCSISCSAGKGRMMWRSRLYRDSSGLMLSTLRWLGLLAASSCTAKGRHEHGHGATAGHSAERTAVPQPSHMSWLSPGGLHSTQRAAPAQGTLAHARLLVQPGSTPHLDVDSVPKHGVLDAVADLCCGISQVEG